MVSCGFMSYSYCDCVACDCVVIVLYSDCVAFKVVSCWFHVGLMRCFMQFLVKPIETIKQLMKWVLKFTYTRKKLNILLSKQDQVRKTSRARN